MFTKAGLYSFIYGKRIGNATAPAFLRLRSSNSFIIGTIAIAVFTVRRFYLILLEKTKSSHSSGHLPLFIGGPCFAVRVDREGRRSGRRFAAMDIYIFECLWSRIGNRIS